MNYYIPASLSETEGFTIPDGLPDFNREAATLPLQVRSRVIELLRGAIQGKHDSHERLRSAVTQISPPNVDEGPAGCAPLVSRHAPYAAGIIARALALAVLLSYARLPRSLSHLDGLIAGIDAALGITRRDQERMTYPSETDEEEDLQAVLRLLRTPAHASRQEFLPPSIPTGDGDGDNREFAGVLMAYKSSLEEPDGSPRSRGRVTGKCLVAGQKEPTSVGMSRAIWDDIVAIEREGCLDLDPSPKNRKRIERVLKNLTMAGLAGVAERNDSHRLVRVREFATGTMNKDDDPRAALERLHHDSLRKKLSGEI